MLTPVEVKALSRYRICLRYTDGVEGTVDLSELAGRGVFRVWDDPTFFESVRFSEHGAVGWGEDIDLCPDALYMTLTSKGVEEVFPKHQAVEVETDA